MTIRTQRLLLIVLFVAFVIGILLVTWFLFFKPLVQPPTNANANINGVGPGPFPNVNTNRAPNTNVNQPIAVGPGALPKPSDVANGDLTLTSDVLQRTTFAPNVAADGKNIVYYDNANNKFVRFNPDTGESSDLSSQQFPDIQAVTWAPDRTKAVLTFPDDTKIVYDFSAQKQYTLPKQGQDFSFSGDSKQLAYEYIGGAPDENFLVTSDVNGNGTKAVAKIGDKADQVQVAWSPTNEVVGLFRQGSNADSQEVVLIGQNQENFKSIQTDGRGFQGKWTPDGSKLLYTVYSEATNWNPELHLVFARGNTIGQGDVSLGLSTFLNKCAFNQAGSTAYCAVPDALERGSGLYPEFAVNVYDTLYTVNLSTGSVRALAQPVTDTYGRFTVEQIFLSSDGQSLYFSDSGTHRIHKVRLK